MLVDKVAAICQLFICHAFSFTLEECFAYNFFAELGDVEVRGILERGYRKFPTAILREVNHNLIHKLRLT